MNSGKTVCKEVCSVCKCMVKEKAINNGGKKDNGGKRDNGGKKECTATIVGVINLPEEMCNNKAASNSKNDDCEVFRDMGECLQKCILKVSKNNGDSSKFGDKVC